MEEFKAEDVAGRARLDMFRAQRERGREIHGKKFLFCKETLIQ